MKKNHVGILVEKNALIDEGDGLIRFPNKLVITDNTEQRNGTRYDISSMDLSEYKSQITADHIDMLGSIIGKVKGLAKIGNKVVVDAIQYAVKENALARLAYDLLIGGFSTDFSIETYGEPVDNEGVYKNAKLIGLSQVVVGNNRNATLNNIVFNSIEQSKKDGLDVTEVEKQFLQEVQISQNHNNKEIEVTYVTIKNTRDFPVVLTFKNAEGEDSEVEVRPGKSVDVPEEQKEALEGQIKNAKAPEEEQDTGTDLDAIKNLLETSIKPLAEKVEELEKSGFSAQVTEPEFVVNSGAPVQQTFKKNAFEAMDWEERAVNQIESFRRMEKQGDMEAGKTLRAINEVNLAALKQKGLIKNAITIGDLGNYVISPEQLTEIVGFRSDYSDLVDAFTFRETLSTVTQWLKRSGDISMTHVDYDAATITDSGYLKPISTYSATLETMELEELAAVTPVANAATRFLAADILGDVNQGYRTDYQRKLAQLIVARLEQAVDSNGLSEIYNTTTDVGALKDITNVIGSIAESVPNGVFVMNHKSYWQLVSRILGAGISGPLSNIFNTGDAGNPFGNRVVLTPNDLLPTLNTAETKTHVIEGANVTINHAVFYVNPTNWVGRVSGGLQYDLSTDAAYESGGTVYSAFQRNQIVLRGAMFRAGEVADTTKVAGLLGPGVS